MLCLRSRGQVVRRDQGVTSLFERSEEVKYFLTSVLDSRRWFTIRLTLHSFSLSRGCVSSRPRFELPMSRGTGRCRSAHRGEPPLVTTSPAS